MSKVGKIVEDIYNEILDYKAIVDLAMETTTSEVLENDIDFVNEISTMKGLVGSLAIINKHYDISKYIGDENTEYFLKLANGWFPSL